MRRLRIAKRLEIAGAVSAGLAMVGWRIQAFDPTASGWGLGPPLDVLALLLLICGAATAAASEPRDQASSDRRHALIILGVMGVFAVLIAALFGLFMFGGWAAARS